MSRMGDQYRYSNYGSTLNSPLHQLAIMHERNAAGGWAQANNENAQKLADLQKYGHGDPRTSQSVAAMFNQITPMERMASEQQQAAQHATNAAYHAENRSDTDRQMDLAENNMMAKSSDSRYAADRGVEASNYQADKQVEGLRAINEGFGDVLGNLNKPAENANSPDVYYTDEYGNPIGQTTWNRRNRR